MCNSHIFVQFIDIDWFVGLHFLVPDIRIQNLVLKSCLTRLFIIYVAPSLHVKRMVPVSITQIWITG